MADVDVQHPMDFAIDTVPETAPVATSAPRKRSRKRQGKSHIAREKALAALVFNEAVDSDADDIAPGADLLDADSEDEDGVVGRGGGVVADEGEEGEEGEAVEEDGEEEEGSDGATPGGRRAMLPAWQDDDDAKLTVDVMAGASRLKKLRRDETERRLAGREYEARLRAQFEATQPSADWAALPKQKPRKARRAGEGASSSGGADERAEGSDSDDSDTALEEAAQARLLRGASSLLSAPTALPSAELSVKRTADLNAAGMSHSAVACIDWHPNAQLALTAGYDKTVRLFRVDGQANAKLQAVHLPRLPVSSAVFSPDGAHVLACGRSRQWASFDLHAGKAVILPGVIGREVRDNHTPTAHIYGRSAH